MKSLRNHITDELLCESKYSDKHRDWIRIYCNKLKTYFDKESGESMELGINDLLDAITSNGSNKELVDYIVHWAEDLR